MPFPDVIQHTCGKTPQVYLQSNKAKRQVVFEARIYLLLYALLAVLAALSKRVSSALFQVLVITSSTLGQPFLRFYLLAEQRGRTSSPLVYENTRTMQTNCLFQKLAWNMPFHMEHHAWPSVPFHQLGQAHELLVNATQEKESSLLKHGEQVDSSCGRGGYIQFHLQISEKLVSWCFN